MTTAPLDYLVGCVRSDVAQLHTLNDALALREDSVKYAMLSRGERLMLRVAFDLYNGSGNVHLNELVALDKDNLGNVLAAIIVYRRNGETDDSED